MEDKNDAQTMQDFYEQMHNEDPNLFPGQSIRHHIKPIGEIIEQTKSKTILDYGCGQGKQYTELKVHEQWGVEQPHLYDIGVPEFRAKPEGTFDGVVCTDVLEHVPRELLPEVLEEIFNYGDKFTYLVIAMFPAGELLPDGRNAHVSLFDKSWWIPLLQKTNKKNVKTFVLFRHTVDQYEGGWM